MSKINSRSKGCVGEREFSNMLKRYGYEARRGQQFSGGGESPDVVCEELPYNLEIKRVEKLNIDKAMDQSVKDAQEDNKVPVVGHRKNHRPWMVTMLFEDWIDLVKKVY